MSAEEIKQIMANANELDALLVQAQNEAREAFALGVPLKEHAVGTKFDGGDFESLIAADTMQKRLEWFAENFPT